MTELAQERNAQRASSVNWRFAVCIVATCSVYLPATYRVYISELIIILAVIHRWLAGPTGRRVSTERSPFRSLYVLGILYLLVLAGASWYYEASSVSALR